MRARRWAVVGVTLLASLALTPGSPPGGTPAHAYSVSSPKPLAELATSADLIVKGTVVSDQPVSDAWFDPVAGFEAREARLAVVSVIKGSAPTRMVRFRHYARTQGGASYEPPNVTLAPRRTYVVFASNAGGGVHRQLAKDASRKPGEGVILAGDDRPHRGKTVADAVWAELAALLASQAPDDVITAMRELDERSGGRRSGLADFARRPVLELLRPLIQSATGPVQDAALAVFGTQSPYTDDDAAPYFLAAAGKGVLGGLTPRPIVKNTDAGAAVWELTAVADGKGPADRRALAIRVLGRSGAPLASITGWLKDPEPLVRSAAVLLAADLPDARLIAAAATDPSEVVRHGAARAIGFAQDASLVPALGTLIVDPAGKVRAAAALSLLSFSPSDAGAVMKAHLASGYRPLFINALARKDPALYLAELAEVIEKDMRPADWWGGTIPPADSWSILFGYVKKQPAADLPRKLGPSLDALEKLKWFSSSEARDLYALYLVRGLTSRARLLRDAVNKSMPSFNMDYYFDMVDKDPAAYVQP